MSSSTFAPVVLDFHVQNCRPTAPVFAIGDVHGMADQFAAALERGADILSTDRDAKVVLLGDLIDRGPCSIACLTMAARFRDAHPGRVELLAGNHEGLLLAVHYTEDADVHQWALYNCRRNRGPLEILVPEFRHTLAELRLDPSAWKSHTESGNVLFVHAGIPSQASDMEIVEFLRQPLIYKPDGNGHSFPHWAWIRAEFVKDHIPWPGHFVVHGHTPWDFTREPRAGRLNLDAGSYKTGRVCGALLRDGNIQVSIFGL